MPIFPAADKASEQAAQHQARKRRAPPAHRSRTARRIWSCSGLVKYDSAVVSLDERPASRHESRIIVEPRDLLGADADAHDVWLWPER
jgi:hypothetical protein